MKQQQALMIGGAILVLGVGFFVWKKMKAKKLAGEYGMPNLGSPTSSGSGGNANTGGSPTSSQSEYDPKSSATAIKDSMSGFGTDEDKFFQVANNLSSSQKKAVVTYFNTNFGDLKDWIEGDFSGSDEKKALRIMGL